MIRKMTKSPAMQDDLNMIAEKAGQAGANNANALRQLANE